MNARDPHFLNRQGADPGTPSQAKSNASLDTNAQASCADPNCSTHGALGLDAVSDAVSDAVRDALNDALNDAASDAVKHAAIAAANSAAAISQAGSQPLCAALAAQVAWAQPELHQQERQQELFRLWLRDGHVHPLIHLMREFRAGS
jgi:hypothetical protein